MPCCKIYDHFSTSSLMDKWHLTTAHHFLARMLVTRMQSAAFTASQHIKRVDNVVADFLCFTATNRGKLHLIARDCPPININTMRFQFHYTAQKNLMDFEIPKLSDNIICWLLLGRAASPGSGIAVGCQESGRKCASYIPAMPVVLDSCDCGLFKNPCLFLC